MSAPLAQLIRPKSISDIVGQRHLIGDGMPLKNIIESGSLPNMIFYGPSGVGKTTVASIIAQATNRKLCKLNGTTAGTADIKNVVAQIDTFGAQNGILLYLDEIQYFNKKQQQTLLEYIESGAITLIASTTENPYFYIYNAILSRSTVFEFKSVLPEDIMPTVHRAIKYLEEANSCKINASDDIVKHISTACGGDVRKAINSVELCFLSTKPNKDSVYTISMETANSLTQRSSMKYDKDGDEHYDIVSAYQKSMRGSDPNAALHYLARLLDAGDLPSACRRLMVCASEDVGLAYPMIIPIVKSAVDAAMMLGLPEARIPLADAVILVCNSPKSNSAYNGINAAMADVQSGKNGPIPRQLQNMHYDGDDNKNKGQFYLYAHDFPDHWVAQQYLPDAIKSAQYYEFGQNKIEQAAKEYWDRIKKRNK